jgi:hypothetical protein
LPIFEEIDFFYLCSDLPEKPERLGPDAFEGVRPEPRPSYPGDPSLRPLVVLKYNIAKNGQKWSFFDPSSFWSSELWPAEKVGSPRFVGLLRTACTYY